jgi:hypothetical protein
MSKKLIIHLCILGALILYTFVAWNSTKSDAIDAEKAREEAAENPERDPRFDDVRAAQKDDDTARSMMRVGIPLFITVIYGGILTVFYVLPMCVDRFSQEMMGSTAEVDEDPLNEARAAVAAGDYPDAIRVYREVWKNQPEDRFPVMEIAKIQRVHLKNPAVAVSTLEEALNDHEWEPDDAAFFLFRMIEIYEEDLDDREQMVATLEKVTKDLEGTRHAANAAHKLRELGAA